MAVNREKINKNAEKHIKAGRLEAAISEYLILLKENPKDWQTRNQVGDLYARLGKVREAVHHWTEMAEFYAQDGFLLKAIAMYGKVRRIDPNNLNIVLKLADLNAKQGLINDARDLYVDVAGQFQTQGKIDDALNVYRRIVDIDRDNIKIRIKLAELYAKEKMMAEAVEEFTRAAEELQRRGQTEECVQVLNQAMAMDRGNPQAVLALAKVMSNAGQQKEALHAVEEALQANANSPLLLKFLGETYLKAQDFGNAEKFYKRLVETDPTETQNLLALGQQYLKRNQLERALDLFEPVVNVLVKQREGEKAIGLLRTILNVSSSHIPTLRKLVDIYQTFKQRTNLIAALSSLSDALYASGDSQAALAAMQQVIDLDPENYSHREKLVKIQGEKEAQAPQAPAAAGRPSAAPVEAPEVERPLPPRPPARPKPPRLDTDEGVPAQVLEYLTEADVFTRYNLVDKALEQLLAAIKLDPRNCRAHTHLREIYQEKGYIPEAIAESITVSEILQEQGEIDAAREVLMEASQLDPTSAPLRSRMEALERGAAPPPEPARARAKPGAAPPAARPAKAARVEEEEEFEIDLTLLEAVEQPEEPSRLLREVEEVKEEEPATAALPPEDFVEAIDEVPELVDEIGTGAAVSEFEQTIRTSREAVEARREEEEVGLLDEFGPGAEGAAAEVIELPEEPVEIEPALAEGPEEVAALEMPELVEEERLEVEERPVFGEPQEVEMPEIDLEALALEVEAAPKPGKPAAPPPPVAPLAPPAVAKPAVPPTPVAPPAPPAVVRPAAPPTPMVPPAPPAVVKPAVPPAPVAPPKPPVRAPVAQPPVVAKPAPPPPIVKAPIPEITPPRPPVVQRPMPTPPPPVARPTPSFAEDIPELRDLIEEVARLNVHLEPPRPPASAPPPPPVAPVPPVVTRPPEIMAAKPPVRLGTEAPLTLDEVLLEDIAELEAIVKDAAKGLQPRPAGVARGPAGIAEEEAADLISTLDEIEEVGEVEAAEVMAADLSQAPIAPGLEEALAGAPAVREEVPTLDLEDRVDITAVTMAPPEPAARIEAAAEPEKFFDLGSELEADLLKAEAVRAAGEGEIVTDESQSYQEKSLEELFTEFKRGIDKQLGEEDFDTRYNLGIAYKEMGLIDEAIGQFQIAARDPTKFLECCSLLGLCFLEKGMPKQAVSWLKKGIESPGHKDEEYQGLRYDLGLAYEQCGEYGKAMEAFRDVFGFNANYRAVGEKIKELEAHLARSKRS
ncbi:MAG: tetratricopeptide repeat protein [Acidobacteriota bacterium]